MTVLDRFAEKLERLRRRYEDSDRLYHGDGFITGEPLTETEIHQIEEKHHVALPGEYRAFLARFEDGDVVLAPSIDSETRSPKSPVSRFLSRVCFWGCVRPK
jgi:hypothetical protein